MRISKMVLPAIVLALLSGGLILHTDAHSAQGGPQQGQERGQRGWGAADCPYGYSGWHGPHGGGMGDCPGYSGHGGYGGQGQYGGMGDCPGMGQGKGGRGRMGGMGSQGGHGNHGGPGGPGGMYRGMNISPEQRSQGNAVMQEGTAVLQPMREQMFVKQQELRALQNASNPDVTAVNKKAQEINALREQMRKEYVEFGKKLDQALGLPEGTHTGGR